MTAAQMTGRIGSEVVFTCGRLKGVRGTVVDVRHEGHHVRVRMDGGRTVSTRPGAIKAAPARVDAAPLSSYPAWREHYATAEPNFHSDPIDRADRSY